MTAYPESKLDIYTKPVIGKKVTLVEVYDIAQRITQYYRDDGYVLASAYLPPQGIKDGIVTIQIVEGYVGEVK